MATETIETMTSRATQNIIRFGRTEWAVPSRREIGVVYRVDHTPEGYRCTCPAGQHGRTCWHVRAVDDIANPKPAIDAVRERFEAERLAFGVALLRGKIDSQGRPRHNG